MTIAPGLAKEAKKRLSGPNMKPADSASLVIVDTRGKEPHVLMGRRSDAHVFYPGAYVFPGGRVDPDDASMSAAIEPDPELIARLKVRMRGRPSLRRARAIALAGIREAFEEAGILIGKPGKPTTPVPKDWQGFVDHGLLPDPTPLVYFMRATTPPRRPRRFDNRFFAVDVSAITLDLPREQRPTDELGDMVWVPLTDLKSLHLPNITQVAMEELQARLASPDGLATKHPVPYYFAVGSSFRRELL
ncbi:NUDIX hydrolase [Microbaculum sp. FT89]|uniref:NUDIX hydrolase n=1 Tax=Microbaculum sp. FT89 TaxID=3447298 RepID=UPI003F539660